MSRAALGLFTSMVLNEFTLGPDGIVYATTPSDSIARFDATSGAFLGTFAATSQNPSHLAFRPIPEPSTALLTGLGLAILGARRRTQRWRGDLKWKSDSSSGSSA